MRKIILTLAFIGFLITGFSQAKKPTIMVIPSDIWCNKSGYMNSFDNQGHVTYYPDYEKALLNDADLNLAISKIGELMTERGFPLKDLSATLKSLKQQSAEESLTVSKSGDELMETALEKLNKIAKADIILMLTWTINKNGPQKSLTYNLQGIDAYTNKQIAAASGTGDNTSFGETAVLLEEAVLSHIEQFNTQLQGHFDDLFANGREVSVICKRWGGSDIDFESYVNDDEFGIIIEDWIADNTVNGRFNTTDYSANILTFEQVRIPLENTSGRAIDTRRWISGLTKMLKIEHNIDTKIITKGLGQVILVVGEK